MVTETFPPEVNGVAMTMGRMVAGLRERHHCIQLIRPRQHPAEVAVEAPGFQEVLVPGLPIPRYDTPAYGAACRWGAGATVAA